jgi:hypothetical protein
MIVNGIVYANMDNMKNTMHKGSVRNIIFKEDNTWFAVALEFNIVIEGDTPEVASFNLQEAILGYLESLRNSKIGGLRTDAILNQTPDPEYEKLWQALESNKPIPSPYQIHSFGRLLLPA